MCLLQPEDFPKALYLVTALEIIVFSLGGAIGYYHLGSQYVTSPAYGSLVQPYVKIVSHTNAPKKSLRTWAEYHTGGRLHPSNTHCELIKLVGKTSADNVDRSSVCSIRMLQVGSSSFSSSQSIRSIVYTT